MGKMQGRGREALGTGCNLSFSLFFSVFAERVDCVLASGNSVPFSARGGNNSTEQVCCKLF